VSGTHRFDRVARGIDALSDTIGRACGWLTLAMVALVFALVVARYLFQAGSLAVQEAALWLHAVVFMLGIAFALRHGQHVRVDLLQQRWSPRGQAIAELLGTLLFLLPLCGFMLWVSLDYVAASWAMREGSRESGGLPGVFVLKTLIPATAALLALQGLAQAWRAWRQVRAPA
jgi:TRAP-type mannitol/chloroaromatic compound transport system permease small subunit